MTSPQDFEQAPQGSPRPAPYLPSPGARPDYYRDPRYKSPLVATVLSLMPGVGQVYLGYTQLGFIHGTTAAALVCLMSSNQLGQLEPMVGIFMAFFWLYNLVDAHRRAVLLNEASARLERPRLPDGLEAMSAGGRLAAGGLLIAAGTLSLLHLRFGVSMAWIGRWWPAGLVLLGLYLVIRALRDRAAQTNAAD